MIKQKFQPNLSSMYKHFLFFECYKKTNDHRTIIKNPFSSLALIDNTSKNITTLLQSLQTYD